MRFFVSDKNIDLNNQTVLIEGGDASHIKNSLRLKRGDIITVSDQSGTDYSCEITELSASFAKLSVVNSYPSSAEPEIKVTLFQALPKPGKLELVIEKCVELGVYEIVPCVTRYTIVKINDKIAERLLRFNKISESAAKQCGRAVIPKVSPPVCFKDAVSLSERLDIAVAAYEKETETKMRHALEGFSGKSAGLFIGPEGGFSDEEYACFKNGGIKTVSLGKRILRTETAGLAALTIFFSETGEF